MQKLVKIFEKIFQSNLYFFIIVIASVVFIYRIVNERDLREILIWLTILILVNTKNLVTTNKRVQEIEKKTQKT